MNNTPENDAVSGATIQETIDSAASVAEKINGAGRDTVTLSTGVVLRLKPVPPLAIREAAVSSPPPAVPTVWIEDRKRDEPNPNDPDYQLALQRYAADQIYRVSNIMMLLGTEIETVPAGIDRPEDEDWIDRLEVVGVLINKTNKHARYLGWLRWYAMASNSDIREVIGEVTAKSGVMEVEVEKAAAAFRGDEERGADSNRPDSPEGEDRN